MLLKTFLFSILFIFTTVSLAAGPGQGSNSRERASDRALRLEIETRNEVTVSEQVRR